MGKFFPEGLFVTQDDANPGANQNFKFVPWQNIAKLGPKRLLIDPKWNPRRPFGTTAGDDFSSKFDREIEPLDVAVDWATQDKPQSKVWTLDGNWFGMFPVAEGFRVFRLEGNKWADCSKESIAFPTNAKADCLSVGKDVYALLVREAELAIVHFEYTKDSYKIITKTNITALGAVETASIAMDSVGKIWITGDENEKIFVYSIDSALDAKTLQGPYVLASGVKDDDISSIISFGGKKVGVFWSDQHRSIFGFRYHVDGDVFDKWSELEVVDDINSCSDDHINLKTDLQGNIYAVVKTSFDDLPTHKFGDIQIALYTNWYIW